MDQYTSSAVIHHAKRGRKKRRLSSEEGDDHAAVDDPPNPTKKSRFVWTPDRHQQFLNAVIHLGIDSKNAVPRKILELMNVPGLTREIVASHLQKFRLRLKKKSDEAQQKPNHSHAQKAYGVSNYEQNTVKNFPQQFMAVDDALSSGYGTWEWPRSNALDSLVLNSGDVLMDIIQQHQMQEYQQKQQQLQQQQSLMHDLIYSDSTVIQPSYFMGPSQPYETLQVGISPSANSMNNYNYSFGSNSLVDHSTFFSPQPSNSLSTTAELCEDTATPSPPILCSGTPQLHNGAAGPFSAGPSPVVLDDALVPYGSGSVDSTLHHQGQVSIESHSHINIMKEQPYFINDAQVDHTLCQIHQDIYPSCSFDYECLVE